MFEDDNNDKPAERATDPVAQALEKSQQFRMHAEFCAVYEGCRKFDAQIRNALDSDLARDVQRTIGLLAKSKSAAGPVLPEASMPEASRLLNLPESNDLPTNDYHVHRRPGETMIVRWLAGEEVEWFYQRIQAHFDAAITQAREEERHATAWKQDEKTLKYLEALDKIEEKIADRYLRPLIKEHGISVLSTQTADELDILHLCDYVMGVDPAEVVGAASAPGETPTEQDRAWFFKLFSLRGLEDGVEKMMFFTYLQKTDEAW